MVERGVVLNDEGLREAFGVGDLAGVEGTAERIVKLSPSSSLLCPMHEGELRSDACRTCAMIVRGVERMNAKHILSEA